MNFNTTNSTFRQLMGNGLSYRVPLFQRDYSWGLDEWDDLWQDIVALFGEDPEPAHYMGYLVLQSADNRAFDIIDGQQRMTTLSLLMLAAVAHLTDLAPPGDPDDPQRRRAEQHDAHASEFNKLGRVPVLKARMNADLHMADDLKNTGKGNLFVIFGEPDIDILDAEDSQIQVKVNGVDVFHPNTGEIRSDSADGIACWFVDTDYNEESFFVRQAYFLGANDPYQARKTTLKAEVNQEAWETLRSDTSRPFARPTSGRIAVKVINHLGDEVMKVFRV